MYYEKWNIFKMNHEINKILLKKHIKKVGLKFLSQDRAYNWEQFGQISCPVIWKSRPM
jgi:hypothetical protein